MANSPTHFDPHGTTSGPERLELGEAASPLYFLCTVVGVAGIILALALGWYKDSKFAHFFFAYLVAFCFVLSLAIGALFFVLLQYLTKAGWSVNVRRIAEWMASSMPIVAAMSAPLLVGSELGQAGGGKCHGRCCRRAAAQNRRCSKGRRSQRVQARIPEPLRVCGPGDHLLCNLVDHWRVVRQTIGAAG
jgi:hypothetical protein